MSAVTTFSFIVASGISYFVVRDYTHDALSGVDPPRTTVVTPAKLGTLAKATEASLREMADRLRAEVEPQAKKVNATAFVSAVYGSMKKKDVVVVAAFAGPVSSLDRGLDQYLRWAMGSEAVVYTDVDPGPLGGTARCGTTMAAFEVPDTGICAWADHDTLGLVVFLAKPLSEQLKARFLAIRPQIEQPLPVP